MTPPPVAPTAHLRAEGGARGRHRFYRYAGVACRTDCPSVAELERDGWTIEAGPNEWGSFLLMLEPGPMYGSVWVARAE